MNMKTILPLILFLILTCNTESFAAGPWKGTVMDIETKEPLEGAIIVAEWRRAWRTPAGSVSYTYEVKEVVTNKDGVFELPSYTPINLLPLLSYMKGPEFIIFKPGYGSLQMTLGKYLTGVEIEPKEMELSGKKYKLSQGIIELPPLKTREERIKVNVSPVGEKSDWKKQKEFIKLIRQEWQYLYNEDPRNLYKIEEE